MCREGCSERKDEKFTQNSERTVKMRRTQNLKPWPKGVSGNPGGRPKTDLAAEIARLAFEGMNPRDAAQAMRTIAKRNPKMFQVLADRAYGKLKIPIESRSPLDDLTDDQLRERLKILRAKDP